MYDPDRTRTKTPRLGTAERDKLTAATAKAYRGGASIREIAAASGYSFGLVHTLLTEAGVTFRPRGGHHRKEK